MNPVSKLHSQFERLYDALRPRPLLPVLRPLPKALCAPLRWPLNRNYLGFTGQDRRRGYQLAKWLEGLGCRPLRGPCEICGAQQSAWHSENYLDIRSARAVCRECHFLLHRRRTLPSQWQKRVERYARTGDEWYVLTPLDPDTDFAGYLRFRFGPDYDLLSASLQGLPGAVVQSFPKHQLLQLSD